VSEQQIVNGLFLGAIYALFAVGYTLVFGILDILNLAHQAVFMIGAFVALDLVIYAEWNIFVALAAAMVVGGALGVLLNYVAFRPLRRRPDTYFSALISSLAMATIFEAIALRVWGAHTSRFPLNTFPDRTFHIGDATITLLQIVILAISLVLMLGLQLMVQRSRLGKGMRAVAENERAARVLGVDVERVITVSFLISSALGAAAGVLYALSFNSVSPDLGRSVELKGLSIIVLGGMGSIPGAVLGGFVLGVTEVATVAHLGSSKRDAVAFIVLFLILLVRPRGLLGRKAVREA
jgi:branched-chain amino acid transport system permease protein